MSAFDGEIAGFLVPDHKDWFGRAGTLKGPNVSDLAITAVGVSRPMGTSEDGETGERHEEALTLTVARADVSSPGAYNEFVLDGVTWSLEQPPEQSGESMITYRMTIKTQAERTLPGYRRG